MGGMSENLPKPSENTSVPVESSDNEASPSPGSDNTDTRVEGVPVGGVALLAALRAWNRRRKRRRLETSAAAVLETAHAQLRAVTGPAIGATDAEQILGPLSDAPPRPTQFTPNPGSSDSEAADAPDGPVHKSQARAITTSPETDVTATPEPSTNDKKTKPTVARAKATPNANDAPPAGDAAKSHKDDSPEDLVAAHRAAAVRGGGQARIDAQHARGKLTARERIARILDPNTFEELAPYMEHRHDEFGLDKERHAGDGVVTGFGLIDGRRVAIFAQDFTVLGGSFSEVQALKVGRLQEAATNGGLPIIALLDSVGARIQEGVWSLAGFGDLFWRNTQASGVVPQISLMLGPCAGGAVYSPGLTDFVVMTRGNSYMFITGPEVIRTVTGEEVDVETLGGANTHAAGSGVAHFVADDENGAFALTRQLLSYLPSNNVDDPPALTPDSQLEPDVTALDQLIPESAEISYDVREAISHIADRNSFLEVHAEFAQNAVVGFGRLGGRVVAFVANQPSHLAGVLDIDSSDKIARFIRFSDAFNIPIVTLVDCPGFLPGSGQEHHGIIRHGAKIVYAYAEATVPKISVVLRKAYGGAYIVMSSKMTRTDLCLAWPSAEIAVMGSKGAVNILYARKLSALAPDERERERARLEGEFQEQFNSPFVAASAGHIDDVIYPRETRARVASALDFLKDKQTATVPKKHGNIPL